ncbi:nitroreductase family protein [Rhizobium sp. KVB221]|uniref:Nitroreductase family protein n=1 Tax=Rhizobium setariae TaxID=2801340 RepID=A0A936YU47_9HYPH|nr:nitroreductase family protein [Rhizobium setariae]MBL0373171.1 nitroreductase family protein [Rhizobium setariae]
MTGRRKFLTILGGGTILAAGAFGGWVVTRDPSAARQPWVQAGRETDDVRYKLLSYAILAPNPHNRQPWLVDLSVKDEITLYCQADRRLPHTDPHDRQITIGLGCFIELFSLAASHAGISTDIVLFPEGEAFPRLDDRPVAHIRLSRAAAAAAPDPLFAQVLHRRTNRAPFDEARPVDAAVLAGIAAAAISSTTGLAFERAEVERLRQLAWHAMLTETTTYEAAKESVDLLRIGRAEIEANPDGISLAGPLLEGLSMTGLLDRYEMLDTKSSVFEQQLAALKIPFDTAMAFLWVTTKGNSRADQIRAGRDYIRINLAATAAGVGMQPFSQALQEFPEMKPHYAAMREALSIGDGETLQMFVRLGYGEPPRPSPRWPYETRIRKA